MNLPDAIDVESIHQLKNIFANLPFVMQIAWAFSIEKEQAKRGRSRRMYSKVCLVG